VEQVRFDDGTAWDVAAVRQKVLAGAATALGDVITGFDSDDIINSLGGADTVYGRGGDDSIDGGVGGDTLHGEDGNDTLRAGTGDSNKATVTNTLYGGTGNDVLIASGKTDVLYGEGGNDIALGAAGVDTIQDTDGSNTLYGAAGADVVRMGDGNDITLGGAGNETIDGDFDADAVRGRDIVSFNKSDGIDTVSRLGTGSTISIGGGTAYANLSFAISGNNLRLKTASSHYVSLVNWYASTTEKNVSTLQIVIEGTSNYNAASSNPLNNRKIQTFDFLGLVGAYDAAGRPSNFSIANNLAAYRINGSDTDAMGGAIAYQYARTGTLGALTHIQMQAVLADEGFGVAGQSIAPMSGLSASLNIQMDSSVTSESLVTEVDSLDAGSQDDEVVSFASAEPVESGGVGETETSTSRLRHVEQPRLGTLPRSGHSAEAIERATRGSPVGSLVAAPGLGYSSSESGPSSHESHDRSALADDLELGNGPGAKLGAAALAAPNDVSSPARVPAEGSKPSQGSYDDSVLFDRLEQAPSYDFEALAAYFDAQAHEKGGSMAAHEIATHWARVRAYSSVLLMEGAAEDLATAAPLSTFYFGQGNGEGLWHLPVRSAVGIADSSAANLKQFDGIQGVLKALG
jgi:hypothetical protein